MANILTFLEEVVNNVYFDIIFFIFLGSIIIYSLKVYKKGKAEWRYYATGFLLLAIARIIQILRRPLKVGSFLDIIGLLGVGIFLLIGLSNIFFLSGKAKRKEQN